MERTYYTEEFTAIPYQVMVKGLSAEAPLLLAKAVAWYLRARGRMGWYMRPTYGTAHTEQATVVTQNQVPAAAQSKWAPVMEQLHDCDFSVLQYRLPTLIGARQGCVCLLRHASGQTLATVEWMKMRGPTAVEDTLVMELNSYADEDPDVLTGSLKPEHIPMADAFPIPFVDFKFLPNTKPVRVVWQLHQQRIAARNVYSLAADAAVQMHRERAERRFQWLLGQGVLRPLSAREVAMVKTLKLDAS